MIPLVANRWFDLGLQLLDPKYENELNIIEADKDDTKTCCRKMFSKWLNTDKLASWDKVIEALTLIGLDNVASNIKQLLRLQGELVPTRWAVNCPCGHCSTVPKPLQCMYSLPLFS